MFMNQSYRRIFAAILRKHMLITLIMLLLWSQFIQSASAVVIAFNNLGPGDSYSYGGNWIGRLNGYNYVVGTEFIPTTSGSLDELWLGMFHEEGLNEVTLALLSDHSGNPGSTLWQQTFDNQLGSSSPLDTFRLSNFICFYRRI